MTPLVATVISCQQREEARSVTVPQLEAATGVTPTVFLSPCDETQPAGGRGNALASAQAVRHALTVEADLLFSEDDIDLAPDFPRFLDLARRAARVTYMYLHDPAHYMPKRYGGALTQTILTKQPVPAGLYELGTAQNLSGSQCVYLPLDFLKTVSWNVLAAGTRPMDIFLSMTLHGMGVTPLVALPHPVQHRHVRVARRNPQTVNPDKFSKSAALERRWSE